MSTRVELLELRFQHSAKFWIAIIFAIGLIVRVSLILLTLHNIDFARAIEAEPYKIALSLVNNGTYADAYGHGVGPTAHTAPLLPIILAIIINVAGVGLAGYLVRTILAAIVAAAAFAMLPALAVKSRLGILPGVIAGSIGAMAPVNFQNQIMGLFDAPYTMFGLIGLCIVFSVYWISENFPLRGAVIIGLLSGVLCLLNPMVIEILVGWYIMGMLYFPKSRKAFSFFMATVATMMMLCLSPWAYRNYKALGAVVWTRSNFGLELSLSNNDRASAEAERDQYSPSYRHPSAQLNERDKVRQMGELAYNQDRKKEALSWIRNHPERFTQLSLRRLFLFWFPSMKRWWQTIAEALITVLAIFGLIALFKKHHPSAGMFLAVLGFYPAAHLFICVGPRYRLPIEPVLFLLSSCFCVNMWDTLEEKWRIRN
jgi:ABC-type multidrug transport system fused ATPase/permease subunit